MMLLRDSEKSMIAVWADKYAKGGYNQSLVNFEMENWLAAMHADKGTIDQVHSAVYNRSIH